MEVSYPVKIKRKKLEDEFSDFSLSSPGTKIRHLSSEFQPIVEEQEPDISIIFSQSQPLTERNCYVGQGGGDSVVIEEIESSLPVNEEKAIVLFNPMDTPLMSKNEGSDPWQCGPQQHCMIPQPPQNLSTPVTWFR